MTNKHKTVKRILLIMIPIMVVLCAIGGLLIWYFLPMNRINRAFEAEDYRSVVNLYSKLNEKNAEEVKNRLVDIADDYHDDYLKEKAEYKDVTEYFELVMEDILSKNRKTKKLLEEIETVHKSREDFAFGLEYMEAENYLEAIECFERVSELDENNYEKASLNIENCRDKYIDELLEDVDKLLAEEEYEQAQDKVVAALELFPENDLLEDKLNEIASLLYADIEGVWYTTYDFGDLIASEMGLDGYKLYFPAQLVYEFTDSNMHMYVDEDSIESAIDAMAADEESLDALFAVAEDYGFSRFQVELLVNVMYGGSYSAFLMSQYGDEIKSALDAFDYECLYYADSKKIYLDSQVSNSTNYYEYTGNGNSLCLESYTGNKNPINVLSYPVSLLRKYS